MSDDSIKKYTDAPDFEDTLRRNDLWKVGDPEIQSALKNVYEATKAYSSADIENDETEGKALSEAIYNLTLRVREAFANDEDFSKMMAKAGSVTFDLLGYDETKLFLKKYPDTIITYIKNKETGKVDAPMTADVLLSYMTLAEGAVIYEGSVTSAFGLRELLRQFKRSR